MFGAVPVFLLNGLSYVASGMTEIFIREKSPRISQSSTFKLKSLVEGLRYFRNERTIGGISIVAGLLNFVGTPLFLFFPLYAKVYFGKGPLGIGLTFVAVSVGGLFFSILLYIKRDFKNKGLAMLFGTAGCGLLTIALPFSMSFPVFLAMIAVIGVSFAININFINIIQHEINSGQNQQQG